MSGENWEQKCVKLQAEVTRLNCVIDGYENALDLVPNPDVTPGQPRPNHGHHCACGGCHE
jgi:hypothetical protein